MATKARFVLERLHLLRHIPYSRVFSIDDGSFGIDITQTEDYRGADVVHLHWINQAMMSLRDLERLFDDCARTGKRVVWTMHDVWPATGVCHLPGDCNHWLDGGCHDCPKLRYPKTDDLSARAWSKKARIYRGNCHIGFVGCSHYLCDTVSKASLMQDQRVTAIPNPIDTQFFSPGPSCRSKLGLPASKRLILFAAYNVDDANKNFALMADAVAHLLAGHPEMKDEIAIVPVGKHATRWRERFACDVFPFEYVADTETMRDIYRSCDMLVVTSKMENLPNTIAEGMACGLPVVATRVGGIPEMVKHGENGYLASPDSPADFADGLCQLLRHDQPCKLSAAARRHAVDEYSEESVAIRYEQLYND